MPTHEYERLARTALLEVTPDATVGAFVDAVDEGDDVVSLRFANRMPGYPGWRWTVSVARIGDDEPTVLEVELMPGDGSLVAPEWVPWSERLAEYRAAQEGEDGADDDADDDDDDEDADDEDADYDDPDDDESDDDESDDDDDFDADEDDLSESDDDDIDGVDVDELDDAPDADDEDDSEPEPEPVAPPRARRRRAQRVRPVDPDDDLEVDRLDASEVDPDHHRS